MSRPLLLVLACMSSAATGAGKLEYDLVLSGGRVVDGTGAPWFRADVGVRGDRIAAIGDLSKARARRRIDVSEKIVAPGFIDMLGQSEIALLIDNRVESKIRQGITTEITGEGRTVAPLDERITSDFKPWLDKYRLTIDWTDLEGYARRFAKNGSTVNVATFVSATNLRLLVIGTGDAQATPDQLREMSELLERGMRQGALGLSSALIYPPATYADRAELIALAKVAARHGGIYATHVRHEGEGLIGALEEAIAIGREARLPVEIFHLKASGRSMWGRMKDAVALIERARREGVDLTANLYPYDAAANSLAASIPSWAHVGGRARMLERLKDPAARDRIKSALWQTSLGREAPEGILVVGAPGDEVKPFLGKRLSEIAVKTNRTPEEALLHLVEITSGHVYVARFVMSEADIRLAMTRPWTSFCTDAGGRATDGPSAGEGAHPRAFGSFPRVLGRYVREEGILVLEEAVRKMTSLPARRAGLLGRGLLRPGMYADITVFDEARVRDLATWEHSEQYSEGIEYVVVNGKLVLDGGKMTKERPGRFLRRGR